MATEPVGLQGRKNILGEVHYGEWGLNRDGDIKLKNRTRKPERYY